jgi:hypothetical protein
MLTYLLAIVVALGSFTLYMAAFFFPELHRKYDLIWSGVAMFYALVLWVCAGRITGGLLLGQMAAAALIGWFGWQTLALRWEQTPIEQRTQVSPTANSLGDVVQEQTEQLITYLQSEEFKSRLPKNFQEFAEQSKRLFNSAKEVTIALISTTFKSSPKSQATHSTEPSKPD